MHNGGERRASTQVPTGPVPTARRSSEGPVQDDLADRYRLLVDLIPDGVVVHQDGRIVYVNRSVERLAGGTTEQFIGSDILGFIHPDSRAALMQRLSTLTEPGLPSEPSEAVLQRLDGGTVVVESVSVLTSWEGRPAMQAILRDLTDHRAAQAALRYQAALVAHVSDAIIGTDVDGRVTSWNPAAENIFGVAVGDAVGRLIADLLGPALDPRRLRPTEQAQIEVTSPGGVELVVRVAATPLAGQAGYVLLCSDETARRDAEDRFAAVVSALEEGVVTVDTAGLITSVNPGAEQLLGVGAQDLVGCGASVLPLLNQEGEPLGARNPLAETNVTGVAQHDLVVGVDRADGTRIWMTGQARPLSSPRPNCAAVLSLTDVTGRRAAAAQLEYAATHDALTGLANRTFLLEAITAAARSRPVDEPLLAILFVDLDGFKTINDSSGHSVGDEALRMTARRLTSRARRSDLVSRIGGDEFVVLARVAEAGQAEDLARRLVDGLSLPTTGRLRGHQLKASVGIVTAGPDDPRGPTDLVRDADTAMYQAKVSGRGGVAVFDDALRAGVLRRIELRNDLREALHGSGIWVAYQPLIELASGRAVGAEALARWAHPRLGPINPLEFVTVAEQSDLIHDLGQRILATACRDAVAIRGRTADFCMSVNLSVRQLEDPNLSRRVEDLLEVSRLPASALCLEVTESSLAADETLAGSSLEPLRELGVRLAIDDFGTGYSSLARLRTLPVDELKIDRSFITEIATDRQARDVVAAIITLAHALEKEVVAEGVETAEQLQVLTDLSCDLAQGYHFARPAPLAELDLGT